MVIKKKESRRLGVGCSGRLDGSYSILPDNFRYQILSDHTTKCDVGHRNTDNKAYDLNELPCLSDRPSASANECGCETADDERNKPRAADGDGEKEQPRFEVLEFGRFFVHGVGVFV